MDSEFSIDLAGVPGHLSLGFGQGWNRRKLREVENGAESASCDFSALAIKEKSAQEEDLNKLTNVQNDESLSKNK